MFCYNFNYFHIYYSLTFIYNIHSRLNHDEKIAIYHLFFHFSRKIKSLRFNVCGINKNMYIKGQTQEITKHIQDGQLKLYVNAYNI